MLQPAAGVCLGVGGGSRAAPASRQRLQVCSAVSSSATTERIVSMARSSQTPAPASTPCRHVLGDHVLLDGALEAQPQRVRNFAAIFSSSAAARS
jgi:hypothetical protein